MYYHKITKFKPAYLFFDIAARQLILPDQFAALLDFNPVHSHLDILGDLLLIEIHDAVLIPRVLAIPGHLDPDVLDLRDVLRQVAVLVNDGDDSSAHLA